MNAAPPSSDITSLRNVLANHQHLPMAARTAINAFLAKLQQLQHRDNRSGTSGFEREYRKICFSVDKAPGYDDALTPQTKATKAKNRYRDVLPIEKTRVKLLRQSDDYINANYIDGGYIACCAPVPAAIRDFWHMIWQCHVHVILMLTNFVEQERVKADIYWDPKGLELDFDGVQVKVLDESHHSGFLVRRFKVWKIDKQGVEIESRIIQHIQLTTWPDHGVLHDYQVIAPMLDAVNSYCTKTSRQYHVDTRIVVHCSAGIGRSGTFIAIDILLKRLNQILTSSDCSTQAMEMALDIPKVVHRLRSQRPGMVQTPEQYQMIYEYLAAVLSDNKPW
ncbi:receptor-type tyrosine-protein [Plasmopara halstedii]|uniref:Receptor-type tyrosine-protein n=1 Tax=Plasmopara halstedii TaxID=4781 RepID=A0A0P1ARF7_PLAHL|nr:receptor-type tyrosine-protein [Plasmopara halstedii]CEG44032.1 receptor-type tyrosine-protein [Plasmopara halstedii]|eukprot:XP_024580401.1 receptor-type tyrosine-protein [Plasmopara halstedii]